MIVTGDDHPGSQARAVVVARKGAVTVAVAKVGAGPEAANIEFEARVLETLEGESLPFCTPRPLATFETRHGSVLLCGRVDCQDTRIEIFRLRRSTRSVRCRPPRPWPRSPTASETRSLPRGLCALEYRYEWDH